MFERKGEKNPNLDNMDIELNKMADEEGAVIDREKEGNLEKTIERNLRISDCKKMIGMLEKLIDEEEVLDPNMRASEMKYFLMDYIKDLQKEE